MKPPVFSYAAPTTVDECVALLSEYSDDAKILAGGQSLMPLLNLRMVRPSVIVDIGRMRALATWQRENGRVRIGALVRQRAIETEKALAQSLPLLELAIPLIGHPATRSRGTIVGSMCHADPAAELSVCAVLLNAEFVLRSSRGTRTLTADQFFQDALSTAMAADELVEAVLLPAGVAGTGYAFEEISRRHGDFALVSVAAIVSRDDARVAIGGVAPRPVAFRHSDFASKALSSDSDIAAFSRYVAAQIEPNSDLHATADYRRAITVELTKRALQAAQCGVG